VRVDDTRERSQTRQRVAGPEPKGLVRAVFRPSLGRERNAAGIESELERGSTLHASVEEPGADDEDERRRDLYDHEGLPKTNSARPTRVAAGDREALISDTSEIAAGLGPGSGDNENALALQKLQDGALVGGQATLNQAYAALVGDVGTRTNIVQINLDAQQGLSEQLRAVQQSESGVNLDEEAANLIRYQQYYQANAKVIETATVVIDALLGLR